MWRPTVELPPPGERKGRLWVIVAGYQTHSGMRWGRRRAGLARTDNDGFDADDIGKIEDEDHMDSGTGIVTHWMEIDLPPFPEPEAKF